MLVGSCSGTFFAFDEVTGRLHWAYDTSQDGPQANFHGDPLVTGGRIVVGSDVAGRGPSGERPDGHVYSLDLKTGRPFWKHAVPGGVISRIIRRGDQVYGVAVDGSLLCLSLSDGRRLWRAHPGVESARASLRYAPLIDGERVIFSSVSGTVMAVDAGRGETVWLQTLSDVINTELVLQDGAVWVGTMDRRLHRLDPSTGEVLSTFALEGVPYGRPVLLEDSIMVLQDGRRATLLSASDGEQRWRQSAVEEWSSFRPTLRDGLIWLGNGQGQLVALDPVDGRIRRTLQATGTVRGFSISDGVFYVGNLKGTLYALRP